MRGLRSQAHHLAYVIYTSGSTGKPKVWRSKPQRRPIIYWARGALDPQLFGETLFSTSLNFDLSVYECFVPLSIGKSIRIVANALALASSQEQ